MKFKPMLADPCTDTSKLRYPVLVSKKFDGIRCMVQDGRLVSRSLKPIKNQAVQAKFAGLPEGTDGELVYGDPSSESCFRDTTSIVMSSGKPADGVKYYVFDQFDGQLPFEFRLGNVHNNVDEQRIADVIFVEHVTIENEEELLTLEIAWLKEGHEGVMIRDPKGPYKQGRSTEAQGWLLKLKRFDDAEARITGFEEMLENQNVATTNALGRTERSSHKAGMVPKGTMGKICCVGVGKWDGVEFNIGTGFDMATRDDFWKRQAELVGSLVKYKFQAIGSKDAPRIPVFHGLRDAEDM